ncbi:MAG TPA: response regulator transcription factor [Candidatus Saccharimonadales bacterium]|nr:response regulator transcription factor [Candidatus Saccharimonadales bacterium]
MRILVVEDDHTIAQAIKEGLEQESYAVDVEFDGDDGFAAASTGDYDLLVLDVMLPGMTGLEIAKKLREDKVHVRIIMLTAKDQVPDRVRGLNTGADDYMVKPFSFEELLARIRALLRRPDEKLGEVLEVGDLTLDTIAKEVKRGKTLIPLSSKEFALLEYMLRNKGRVLSKNNLINHVWDFDADVLPNTVEVFMNYLRTKIDKPFKGPALIQTVRGFGYKVDG